MINIYPQKCDLITAMQNPPCYKASGLIGGNCILNGHSIAHYAGGYSFVFPFIDKYHHKIAVKCLIKDIGDAQKRTQIIFNHLSKLNSPYFVPFYYVEKAINVNGYIHPAIIMDWVEGYNLKDYLKNNIHNRTKILELAANFMLMVRYFHANAIAHGDLQHGNIRIKNDGSLLVLDYDSMYVNGLDGMPDNIKGLPGYQHPSRGENITINRCLDYFSELVIYLSLLVYADYYTDFRPIWNYGTEYLIFSSEDFENPSDSEIFNKIISSKNNNIHNLAVKLKDFLNYRNILFLKPLEEMVQDKISNMTKNIIDKF